jgi:hypothetical protein
VDKVRRIALVGNGATTRQSDNFAGEIWTTAKNAFSLPRVDRIFEVHKEYDAGRLNGYTCPVMTDGVKADIENSEDLGIDWMVQKYGPVFQFSYDYMLALIYDLPDSEREHIEITTYGIDLTTDTEYNQFRQSFFYWIGMLRGSGVTVNISQGSAIFNRRWVYCHERDDMHDVSEVLLKRADPKIEEWESKADEARLGIAFANGYKQCATDLGRMGA